MDKKGFTLIELLATIVIIAIIMALVMPSAIRVSKNNKQRIYQEYENMMVEYAKVSDLNINDTIDLIDLEELDKVKNECSGYVEIDHTVIPPVYKAYISCGDQYTTGNYNNTNSKTIIPIPSCRSGLIYNGGVQELVLSNVGYTLNNNTRKDVGKQDVEATIINRGLYVWTDGTSGSKTISNCEIHTKEITVKADNKTMVYGGNVPENSYTLTNSISGENPLVTDVTYTYKDTSGNTVSINSSTPVGIYSIVPSVEVDSNYEVNLENGIIIINKAESVSPTVSNFSGGYDGLDHTITVSGGSGGTIKYSTDSANWSTIKPTRTDEGTTTIFVRVFADNNHNDSSVITSTVTIYNPTLSCPTSLLRSNTGNVSISSNNGAISTTYTSLNTNLLTINNGTVTADSTNTGVGTVRATLNYQSNSITRECSINITEGTVCYYTTGNCIKDYVSVQSAIDDTPNNTLRNIKLLNNDSTAVTIPQNKKILINLNSKSMTSSSSDTIMVDGELTINGSGTISSTYSKGSAVSVKATGKATITGGTYTGYHGIITRGVSTTIKNATITGTDYGLGVINASSINFEDLNVSGQNHGLYISGGTGGTITRGTYTASASDSRGIFIVGGPYTLNNVTSTGDYGLDTYDSTVNITGGTYFGTEKRGIYGRSSSGVVSINGGTFKGCQEAIYGKGVTITGSVSNVCATGCSGYTCGKIVTN